MNRCLRNELVSFGNVVTLHRSGMMLTMRLVTCDLSNKGMKASVTGATLATLVSKMARLVARGSSGSRRMMPALLTNTAVVCLGRIGRQLRWSRPR